MTNHEPRFARIAAVIGDATRSRTLARLLDGRNYTATELAQHADVTAATMSGHLKLMLDEQLIKVRAQGRHRYFSLADGDVAHALEALMHIADRGTPELTKWQRPAMRALRHARSCYGHLAGELGVALHDALIHRRWISFDDDALQYRLTKQGETALANIGIDVALVNAKSSRLIYDCMDWSERRDHFAGPLAVALLEQFLEKKWLARRKDSRELQVTSVGQRELVEGLLALS